MTDAAIAARLRRTYAHTVTARRPLADGNEEIVCQDAACALSRAAQVAAPTPADVSAAMPEALYRLSLFTTPELVFALGDRLELSDGSRVWHAVASDSFCYPSHAVTVVGVLEVTEARDAEQEGKGK